MLVTLSGRLRPPLLQPANDSARIGTERCGDSASETGIIFRQGKTGAGVLVEWTDALRATIEGSKDRSNCRPTSSASTCCARGTGGATPPRGFSATWQRLIAKYVKASGVRFTFHDLRAKAGSDKATIEEAAALLGHASTETTKRVYKRNLTRARPVK